MMENYPAGAANDPNAPWNQEDKPTTNVTGAKGQMTFVAGDPDIESIAEYNGKLYVINKEIIEANTNLEHEIKSDYVGVPYDVVGRDEDGDPDIDYYYDEVDIDTDDLYNAAADYIDKGYDGTANEYSSSENFVFLLTPELAEQLWAHDSIVFEEPQVQALIDMNQLRMKYPHAFVDKK